MVPGSEDASPLPRTEEEIAGCHSRAVMSVAAEPSAEPEVITKGKKDEEEGEDKPKEKDKDKEKK